MLSAMSIVCQALSCTFALVALVTAAPAAAQEIWSATLTVGELEFSTVPFADRRLLGYKAGHVEVARDFTGEPFGGLSDPDFTLDGVSHTVTGLYTEDYETVSIDHEGGPAGSLYLYLEPAIRSEAFSLTVNGETFAIGDAATSGPVGCCPGERVRWDTDPFGWTAGQQFTVSVAIPASVPAIPVPALGLLLALLAAAAIAGRRRAR